MRVRSAASKRQRARCRKSASRPYGFGPLFGPRREIEAIGAAGVGTANRYGGLARWWRPWIVAVTGSVLACMAAVCLLAAAASWAAWSVPQQVSAAMDWD